MIHNKRRCSSCGAWFDHRMILCPLCGAEWHRTRRIDICRACGARVAPEDGSCSYCDSPRRVRRGQLGPRLGSLLLSIAFVAIGAGLLWWILPLGAQMGQPLEPTPTPHRPTAVGLVEVLSTPTPVPSCTPTAVLWPTATPQYIPDVDLQAPTLTPTHTPTATLDPALRTEEAPVAAAEPGTAVAPGPTDGAPSPTAPAPEPEPPVPQPTAGPRIHVIAAGDTLGALAVRYGVSSAEIAQANGITLTTVLRIGQELVIPGGTAAPVPSTGQDPAVPAPTPTPRRHVVQAGQHLGIIASLYGVSMAEIAAANNMSVSAILSIGQELIIPQPGGSQAQPAPTATPDGTGSEAAAATPAVQRTPRPTETPTPTPSVLRHVVERGDTLGGLAVRYGVASADIARANGITLTTILRIGQELIIPGAEAEPTAEDPPTPEATPTPTLTVTPSPTPVPLRTPSVAWPYRAPYLLTPLNGTLVQGNQSQPVLQWTSVGILADDEWYQVSVWTPESRGTPTTALTKATYWRVPRELYPKGRRDSRFEWQVTVVRTLDVAPGRVALSPPSETYRFSWR